MEWVKLGDVVDFQNGYAFKSSQFKTYGTPVIRISDLNDTTINITKDKTVRVTEDVPVEYLIKKGDLLLGLSGSVGKIGLYSSSEKAYLNQRVAKVIPKRHTYPPYVRYLIKSLIEMIEKDSVGGTVLNISTNTLKKYRLNIHDINNQKIIADNLQKTESLISTRKAQIAALDELVQSVFYEMFGDVNNLNANNYTHLEDLAEITMGQSPKGDTYNEEGNGMPLLNGPAEFGLKYPEVKKWTTDSKKESKVGDILFCVRASVGLMNISDKEYSIGRGLAAISVEDPFQRSFIFKSLYMSNDYLKKVSTGSTYPSINKEALGKIPIINADEKNIIKFNDLSEAIEAQKAKLQTSLEEMETLFDALMQEAFSGNLG